MNGYQRQIVIADISNILTQMLYMNLRKTRLRPNATIVISEDKTKYPFDFKSHLNFKIRAFRKDIGVSEEI
jgi:hypothetical protein